MSVKITYNAFQKESVYTYYNGMCAICGRGVSRRKMTIAHRVPLSRGGTNSINNLMLACWECGHIKNNMTMEEFYRKIHEIAEYNREAIVEAKSMEDRV